MSHVSRFYLFITIFLLIATITGGIMLAVQNSRIQPVEIFLSQTEPQELGGKVYIGGAVANPGIYPLQQDDTIQAILLDASVEPDADLNHIEIYVPREGVEQSPQKIDINRAEPWLLEALPGVGEVLAQRIVEYRSENGPFKRIEDLLNVGGIGSVTFENMKDYVTVSD